MKASASKDFRVRIGIFGRTNAGKSSLINALTNQSVAIVSSVAGTTTDVVSKAMELLPLGPVKLIDTPGLDDTSELGRARVSKAMEILKEVDVAILVVEAEVAKRAKSGDLDLEAEVVSRAPRVIGVLSKIDTQKDVKVLREKLESYLGIKFVPVSSKTGEGLIALKREIVRISPRTELDFPLIGDLVSVGDAVVLVIPELEYPRGRLPLCHVRAMREIIDCDAYCIVTTPQKLITSPVFRLAVLDTLLSKKDTERCLKFYSRVTSFAVLEARKALELFVKNARAAREKGFRIRGETKDRREEKIIEELLKEAEKAGIPDGKVEVFPESAVKVKENSCTAGLLLLELRGVLKKLLEPFPLARMSYEGIYEPSVLSVSPIATQANVWKW